MIKSSPECSSGKNLELAEEIKKKVQNIQEKTKKKQRALLKDELTLELSRLEAESRIYKMHLSRSVVS